MPPFCQGRPRLVSLGRRAADAIADFVLPRTCAFCGAIGRCDDDWPVCAACYRDLPWTGAACPRCARPLGATAGRDLACGRCLVRPPFFSTAYAPLRYAFPVDAAVKALKFNADLVFAPALAALALPWLRQQVRNWDCLVPVPLHRWRQARRGFNQAMELARWLARHGGLPAVDAAVRRRRTRPQSELPANARRANVRGAFRVVAPAVPARVLLVDDVMTTGETCGELARVLLAAGAAEVGVLCMARAMPALRAAAVQTGTAGSKV